MSRARLPLPKGVPRTLRYQSVTFEVLALGDGRLAFAYYDGSRRVVVKRQSIDELREVAERVGNAVLNAETAALDVTADDRRIYIAARDVLAPHGLAPDGAARIVDEAARLLGSPQRIVEAARWFSQANPHANGGATTVATLVEEFLRSRRAADLSGVYLRKLEKDLNHFATAFAGPIASVRAARLEDWLAARVAARTGQPLSARRRRNLRDAIMTLFNFGRDRGYIPAGLRHEAEKVQRPKLRRGIVAIYTPAEMKVLLEHARDGELPALVIGAFAGLRSAEIMRLEWRDVRLDQNVILLPASKSKTNEPRAVPIRENLRAWLQPYSEKAGWIVGRARGGRSKRLDHFFAALAERSGVTTR